MKMPFGKYKGEYVDSIPIEYLQWLLENVDLRNNLRMSVLNALNRYETTDSQEKVGDRSQIVQAIIKTGYRELAKKFHPDVGGSNEKMKSLNNAHEFLKSISR